MSTCEATMLERIRRPPATTAAAVSSQEDSIPSTSFSDGAMAPVSRSGENLMVAYARIRYLRASRSESAARSNFEESARMMDHPKKVRKAVLPVAGLGTRFLPATKAMPKEMLPVVDKPLIQYAVEECIASGIEHVIIVTGRGKSSIEDHFDFSPELERFLTGKGKTELAAQVHALGNMVEFS